MTNWQKGPLGPLGSARRYMNLNTKIIQIKLQNWKSIMTERRKTLKLIWIISIFMLSNKLKPKI